MWWLQRSVLPSRQAARFPDLMGHAAKVGLAFEAKLEDAREPLAIALAKGNMILGRLHSATSLLNTDAATTAAALLPFNCYQN